MPIKRLPFEEFKNIYSRVPRLTVDLVVQNEEQEILLTLRGINPWKGFWHLPGGTVFFNESLEDAVNRISKSELGIEVETKQLLGCIEFIGQDVEHKFDHSVSVTFLCAAKSFDFQPDEQADEIKFFKEIPENTIKEQKEFLEKLELLAPNKISV